jgi:hypothetical protein
VALRLMRWRQFGFAERRVGGHHQRGGARYQRHREAGADGDVVDAGVAVARWGRAEVDGVTKGNRQGWPAPVLTQLPAGALMPTSGP